MYGIYYKTPIDFKDLMEKKEIEKTNLEHSIAQFINLAATTSFGECKFDEGFGCKIWEMDFDLLSDQNTIKDRIRDALKATIKKYEYRLELSDIEVSITEAKAASYNNGLRMKKKVNVVVNGNVKKTNRAFNFYGYFFVGPLSYI
ncbi:GPW/gp25 family protein [Flavobacterium amniphilum]|uniref:GPW/gp25 family protein n=1 Tax=Flavobacterium amniphilum TaxID=1834035 RepID=UPI00202A1307|nr:GPW/gp25 family protein [Flavobacterium amniphilum]MCL9805336.1 GPW/gp25 family protein [Flavobacterium amniphilum]